MAKGFKDGDSRLPEEVAFAEVVAVIGTHDHRGVVPQLVAI